MTPRQICAAIDARVAQSRRAFYATHPHADALWTVAEERKLARIMDRGGKLETAARALGRTYSAVYARWAELRRCRARRSEP